MLCEIDSSINCSRAMQILEKGTIPACVSDLCSVKLTGVKTHLSVNYNLITPY